MPDFFPHPASRPTGPLPAPARQRCLQQPAARPQTALHRLASAALLACVLAGPAQAQEGARERTGANAGQASAGKPQAPIESVIERAMSLLGIPYRWGGTSPESGFDCSGLVRFVFRETLGVDLPARSDEIGKFGEKLLGGHLQPGDLVFFNTMRKSMSHVGIYLGDGKFLHAPASGGVVRVEKMDMPYWVKRYEGARRMLSEQWQAITLPGVLPGRLHGAETLGGERLSMGAETRSEADQPLAGDPLDLLLRKLGQKR